MRYETIVNELILRTGAIQNQYGFTVIYMALYGSQNYGLDDSKSDIDCVAVVRPTLSQLIDNPEINFELAVGDNGKIKVMDVMSFAKQLAKGSFVNFEALYSDYSIHEQAFKDEFIVCRDKIYQKCRWKLQRALYGGIGNAIKQAKNCADDTEKDKYSKKLYEGMRMMDMYGKVNCNYSPDPYISGLSTRCEFGKLKAGLCSNEEKEAYMRTLTEAVEPNLTEADVPEESKDFDVVSLAKSYLMAYIVNDTPTTDPETEN